MKFGIVGLGTIGRIRIDTLNAAPAHSLAALCDADQGRRSALGNEVPAFASLGEMLASGLCEAVVICTPPQIHEALALEALEAGVHVIVEKPLANTLDSCRRIVETARSKGLVLTTGFNQRYFDAVKVVREALRSGALGTLTHVKGFAGHTGLSEFSAPWMHDKQIMGGGTLCDNGVHMIDLVAHIMGGVTDVYGVAANTVWQLPEVEDNAFAVLRGPAGVTGFLHSTWSEWKGYRFYLEAYGDRGMARAYYAPMMSTVIQLDKPGGTRKVTRNFYPSLIFREKFKGWQSTVSKTFQDEFDEFAALVAKAPPANVIASGADGFRALAIAEAVYASTHSGESVKLESLDENAAAATVQP